MSQIIRNFVLSAVQIEPRVIAEWFIGRIPGITRAG